MSRRLAAILAADVIDYSRLMGAREEATRKQLKELRAIASTRIAGGEGRMFSMAGDGFMAEFASPVSAVRAGFDVQRDVALRAREAPPFLQLRIGVHLADVMVDGDDLLGDGVNIASRIEKAAAPGSVTLSQATFEQVKRTANLTFEELGEHSLKNITEPIRLYRVIDEQSTHSWSVMPPPSAALRKPNSLGDRPSIAVLPFANMSGDTEQEYFADGFSDDLITELARFRALHVISRNASFGYRDRQIDPRQVGAELGVGYCLEGSVRKLGSRIRITAQLIETETGKHIWADRFDRTLEELFDVQDELAAHIVGTIASRVEAEAMAAAKRKRPTDLGAYDCLLRGLELHRLGGVTRKQEEDGLEWLDRAIAIDPNYGRAHAWRACALATLMEWTGDQKLWTECTRSAERAFDLDPNEGEVHRILGSINLFNRKYEKAEMHFKRGLELSPNNAYVAAKTAALYNYTGRADQSLELLALANRLDPTLPDYCQEEAVAAHYVLKRYSDAVAAAAAMNRLTRRAAIYAAAASGHCESVDRQAASRELLRIHPGFSIDEFVTVEPFTDNAQRAALKADLAALGLPA